MNIYDLLDEMDEMIDEAWSLPLTGGKTVLDAEKVREIIDDIRNQIPQEVRQARAIVADRKQILEDAKRDGEMATRKAEDKIKELVARDEIVKRAQQEAADIIKQAQKQSYEIHKVANDYVDNLMKRTDDHLTGNLAQFRKTRQSIKNSQRTGNYK